MPKHQKRPPGAAKSSRSGGWIVTVAGLIVATGAVVALVNSGKKPSSGSATNAPAITGPTAGTTTNAVPSMEANQSVVVTHDLDLGPNPPGLTEVLRQIERHHQPADGAGRAFAILEAFTQPGAMQPDGKLRVSLRVSTEKPGVGEIIFRGARQTNSLWKSRITPATHKPSSAAGSLTILFDNGDGKTFTVDGSTGPASIFDAMLKEAGLPVSQLWPEGAVRDLSFIYSACGCPIHVKCRREGDRTIRTEQASQVIFPDDPAAMQVISRLMRW